MLGTSGFKKKSMFHAGRVYTICVPAGYTMRNVLSQQIQTLQQCETDTFMFTASVLSS